MKWKKIEDWNWYGRLAVFFLLCLSACSPAAVPAPIPVTGVELGVMASAADHPGTRVWASMAYDPMSASIILFGGGRMTDTWSLDVDRHAWSELEVQNRPVLERMGGVSAAYDSSAARLIVFFYKGPGQPGETWALDIPSGVWKNRRSANAPVSRRFTTLVYDQKADKTILFGGQKGEDEVTPTDELWVYDYKSNTWTKRQASGNLPPPNSYLHAVYDESSSQVLLWGGKSENPEKAVWAYDYSTNSWTKTTYRHGPNPDYNGAMVYASKPNRIFLYIADQFWAYDPEQQVWEELPVGGGPGRQYGAALAYDEDNHRLVLFGGTGSSGETWLYDPAARLWSVMRN